MSGIDHSLVEQANTSFDEFLAVGKRAEEIIIEWANKGREAGIRLLSVKDHHRHWEQLTLGMGQGLPDDTPRLKFNERCGKAFIRLADRLREPAKDMAEAMSSIKDVLMLQGTLPFPDGHGVQQLHNHDPFHRITHYAMELEAAFNKDFRDDLATMDEQRKRNLRDQIEPVVRIYELLAA